MRAVKILCLIVAALTLGACGRGDKTALSMDTLYAPEYAEGFVIERVPGCSTTVVTSYNPWQGASGTNRSIMMLAQGEEVPQGFAGQVLNRPAKRIVAMSSTHVAMLHALGAADRIVGVSGLNFISTPSVRNRREVVADVGYDTNIDYERIAALQPDLVLLYGVNGASPMEDKLAELGIPYMYVGEYLETSPLGKAEWLLALAEVTGLRRKAQAVFSPIPMSYKELQAKVARVSKRPKVFFNTPYADKWYMPGTGNYMARLVADAGGSCVFSRNTTASSTVVDVEEAYMLASQADVWLNPGQCGTLADVARDCPRFTDVPSFKSGRVYNNTLRADGGGNDFYESGTVRPDLVLRDLVRILHPEVADTAQFTYFKQLR